MLWHAPCSIPVPAPRHVHRRPITATLASNDLASCRELAPAAMAGVRGLVCAAARAVINFYEINYSFYADQMNNQFQNIDIRNNAPNANINVQGDQGARNDGRLI
ncbi:hypothetical protein [Cupriavidus necator]|uniref:hypothetical protein n=1 Tax=Cupriavidus necator TaxID=106590 RepID=UPI0030F3764B